MKISEVADRRDAVKAMLESLPDPGDEPVPNRREEILQELKRLKSYKSTFHKYTNRLRNLDRKMQPLREEQAALQRAIEDLDAALERDDLSGRQRSDLEFAREVATTGSEHRDAKSHELSRRLPSHLAAKGVKPLRIVERLLENLEDKRRIVERKVPAMPQLQIDIDAAA